MPGGLGSWLLYLLDLPRIPVFTPEMCLRLYALKEVASASLPQNATLAAALTETGNVSLALLENAALNSSVLSRGEFDVEMADVSEALATIPSALHEELLIRSVFSAACEASRPTLLELENAALSGEIALPKSSDTLVVAEDC